MLTAGEVWNDELNDDDLYKTELKKLLRKDTSTAVTQYIIRVMAGLVAAPVGGRVEAVVLPVG